MQKLLSEWRSRIATQPIPIMAASFHRIDELVAARGINIADVVSIVEQDPGLAVQVVRSANIDVQKKNGTEVRSIREAVKILEISKIRKLARSLPSIEMHTTDNTQKMLYQTFYKAYHTAKQAEHWAKLRNDELPDEIYCAAFMHFLGEMYISIYVPNLMKFIYKLHNGSKLVSEEAQYVVLGFTLAELTIEIADVWSLPQFVKQSLHIESVENVRSYGVMLASELVQAASDDWYSERTWGLQLATAVWLGMKPEKLISDSHRVAASVARDCTLTDVTPLANSIIFKPIEHKFTENKTIDGTIDKDKNKDEQDEVSICLTPQLDECEDALNKLTHYKERLQNLDDVIQTALHGMHDGIGLNRVVFYLLTKDHSELRNYMSLGVENDPIFNKYKIELLGKNLFVDVLKKQQAIWVDNDNKHNLYKRLPKKFYTTVSNDTFYSMSIFIKNKPVGLFYADRHTQTCGLDKKAYSSFKLMAKLTATALEYHS